MLFKVMLSKVMLLKVMLLKVMLLKVMLLKVMLLKQMWFSEFFYIFVFRSHVVLEILNILPNYDKYILSPREMALPTRVLSSIGVISK